MRQRYSNSGRLDGADASELALAGRFVSNSANTPSMSRKALPAAVPVSSGGSVGFCATPLAFSDCAQQPMRVTTSVSPSRGQVPVEARVPGVTKSTTVGQSVYYHAVNLPEETAGCAHPAGVSRTPKTSTFEGAPCFAGRSVGGNPPQHESPTRRGSIGINDIGRIECDSRTVAAPTRTCGACAKFAAARAARAELTRPRLRGRRYRPVR